MTPRPGPGGTEKPAHGVSDGLAPLSGEGSSKARRETGAWEFPENSSVSGAGPSACKEGEGLGSEEEVNQKSE